ncbi:hypothetical protein Q7P37_008182 [Cladosporium fusiforme]
MEQGEGTFSMPRPKLKGILKTSDPGPQGGASRERDSGVSNAIVMNRRGSIAVNEVGVSPLTTSTSTSVAFDLEPGQTGFVP